MDRNKISLTVLLMSLLVLSVRTSNSQTSQARFKHQGKIAASYDKGTDQTTVFLKPYVIKTSTNPMVSGVASTALTAGFTHSGKTLQATPSTVELGILSESTFGFLYQKDRRFSIKLDDDTLDLGEMKLLTTRFYRFEGNKYREDLAFALPYAEFMRLTNAREIQIKIGQQSFKLKHEHLEALRELASKVVF